MSFPLPFVALALKGELCWKMTLKMGQKHTTHSFFPFPLPDVAPLHGAVSYKLYLFIMYKFGSIEV